MQHIWQPHVKYLDTFIHLLSNIMKGVMSSKSDRFVMKKNSPHTHIHLFWCWEVPLFSYTKNVTWYLLITKIKKIHHAHLLLSALESLHSKLFCLSCPVEEGYVCFRKCRKDTIMVRIFGPYHDGTFSEENMWQINVTFQI